MRQINIKYYDSPVGELILGSFDGKLCLLDWRYRKMRTAIDKRVQKALDAKYLEEDSEIIDKTIMQLEEYFKRERKVFDIPLRMLGTDFQKSVWKGLCNISYGKTASYLDIAKNIGNQNAVRAVASANGANAISILIPCHRIIGSDRALRGYAGGLDAKKDLLEIEGYVCT